MRKIIAIIAAALALASCSCEKNGPDEAFVESQDLMLKVDGKTVLTYDPLTWQLGYREDIRQLRVGRDNMSQYYILTCNAVPVREGQILKASLKWSAGSSVNSRDDLSFKVVRIEPDGRVWLWSTRGIGVSAKIIRE